MILRKEAPCICFQSWLQREAQQTLQRLCGTGWTRTTSAPYLSGTEAREASHGQWHRWSQWTHGHLCRDWYQPLFPDLAPHKRLHPGRGSSRTGWGSSPPQHPPPMKLAVVESVHDHLSFLPPAFSYQHCTEKKLFLMVHVVLGVCI